MIARKGFVLAAVGVGIGLVLAAPIVWLWPAVLVPGMPFEQRVRVVLAAGALLWLVALLASYIPARRASRIDPMVALRHE